MTLEEVEPAKADSSTLQLDLGGSSVASTSLTSDSPESSVVEDAGKFGFEGDPCPECGQFTLVSNGSCLKCVSCGSTTGCS